MTGCSQARTPCPRAVWETFERIANIPAKKNIVLVATGHFIGEGFDEPRLDTLFLAMPISWKGTLQQYAGRLHRLFKTKKEVRIYDYVDIQIKMLENMYQRRLNGYASIRYKAKGEEIMDAHWISYSIRIIFFLYSIRILLRPKKKS